MFLVINKDKVYAYIVSILTIVTLFFMSSVLNSDLIVTDETSTNIEQNIESNSVSNKVIVQNKLN